MIQGFPQAKELSDRGYTLKSCPCHQKVNIQAVIAKFPKYNGPSGPFRKSPSVS